MTAFEQVKAVATAEDEEVKNKKKKKCVLVGIRFDNRSRELLNWALVKVADSGDRVLAIHVCRRGHELQLQPQLDGYLEAYEGLCNVKKVDLEGQIVTGSSIRRALVREAKRLGAAAVLVGVDKHTALGICTGTAKYCAKKLPTSTDVLAVHNGKIVFRRFGSNQQLAGKLLDPRPSLCSTSSTESEAETETSSPEANSTSSKAIADYGSSRLSSIYTSECSGGCIDPRPGWPLLRRANSEFPEACSGRRDLSVVQWVMSFPDRSQYISASDSRGIHRNGLSEDDEMLKEIGIRMDKKLSGFVWFDFEVLCKSTSEFSSENLIGKGGSNRVYKGIIPGNGNEVAVKVQKSSEGSRKDFALEVDIISSLKNPFIAPLQGICVRHDNLYSVYDFFPKGSLEENLLAVGDVKDECGLSWKVRYSIAIGVAEALNYLHNEIPRPVIHRDVKSSNILLTDDYEPKLSDFGLAMWAPTASPFHEVDLVGTFGYLAPEYFMSGKVSDRVDVYSFGVVLLELLSGRKAISSDASKGQESLIMWAKPIIESGDVMRILDPRLGGVVDEVELKRLVLAATLCLTRAARLRPGINQVLAILRGECDADSIVGSRTTDLDISENAEDDRDDEIYPESCATSHMGIIAMLDISDDFTSFSSSEQRKNSLSVEEYIKGRWSRSPSFD